MLRPYLSLASGVMLLVSANVYAQGEADFSKAIELTAGHEELDIKNNRLLLTDNVTVKQGTLEIKAERVEALRNADQQADTFIAEGNPATYTQQLDDGSTISAQADRITYYQAREVLELVGNAQVSQGSSRSSAQIITYDLAQQTVSASGEGSENNRVTTIFTPPKKKKTIKTGATTEFMATLSVRHLAKSYKRRQVVKDVSLDVSQGQIIGLLGPNGAGKTTTFYMIVGLVNSDKGQIYLDDTDLTLLPMHERARRGIGYLPQESSIFRKLTVRDNLMAILETRKNLTAVEREEKVDALLEEFHIGHIANSLGMSLSGGERRRVEIARALAADPTFILLDEPFAGVDPISVLDIKKIIEHLKQRGIGVLITDHNVRETLSVCEHAYIVSHGQLIASGDAESILSNQQVKDVYLGEQFTL